MTAEYSAGSKLEKIFKSGQKAVTGECGPPRGCDVEHFRHKANFLKGYVDAVNVTDNQTAVVRFCSMAAAKILLDMGVEPVMQMVTRDMNRIALQSNILGAAALGIKNLLVPHRRPPVLRRPSPGQERPRPGFRHAGPHPQDHAG